MSACAVYRCVRKTMRSHRQRLSALRGGRKERTRASYVLRGSDHTCETVQQRRTAAAAVQVRACLYITAVRKSSQRFAWSDARESPRSVMTGGQPYLAFKCACVLCCVSNETPDSTNVVSHVLSVALRICRFCNASANLDSRICTFARSW